MATLTLNPIKQDGIAAGQANASRTPNALQSKSTADSAPAAEQDSVILSASATPVAKADPATVLSESEADAAALSLRHQLGSQSLSVTAKQNQAIVALLRR